MKKLTIPLTDAEYDQYKQAAKDAKITVPEWAKRKLKEAPSVAPDVMEEAFRRLDESDAIREFSPPPPPPEPPKQFEAKVSVFGKPLPVDHACAHHAHVLRDDGGPPLICGSSGQLGRPCYFSSNRASDCLYFSPRGRG